ncbi:hypothetical protein [Mycobacterium botniense]|uniref:Putative lipoprotein LppW n=1 Tax=Mycobacterium botniense TaxID=84962 RepID=A0A7I9Y3D4_9MYCO|nr:hypothetical protein [Mycobacterium botniense]GFG76534.1 putative lipoprotein LppW [Mycobacterium botniense]
MRAHSPLVLATVTAAVLLVSGCEAKVYGVPVRVSATPAATLASPLARAILPSLAPPDAAFAGLRARIQRATEEAAGDGATISVAVLDRATRQMVANGNSEIVATASVAKLFIADDLLLREAQGKVSLAPQDRRSLEVMLRSSDDDAAEKFWNQDGGNAIITQVAARYGLASTIPPGDGRWWNTVSSVPDLIRYYDMLLDGSGGLAPEQTDIIISNLARSTATGIDGYPQRFGIPDGLYAEPVAVKQGWMCCIGDNWMHLSTGVVGTNRRYVVVIESLQPSDDGVARATITHAVQTIFPGGRI